MDIKFCNTSVNTDNKPAKKRDLMVDDSTASIAGWFGGSTIGGFAGLPSVGVLAGMKKYGNISSDKIDIIHKAAENSITVSGMDRYGVNIKYLTPPKKKRSIILILGDTIAQIKNGYNACFLPKEIRNITGEVAYKKNTILMPEKGISFAAFHEIGHSINANKSVFWKNMQRIRKSGTVMSSLILLFGAFSKNQKAQNKNDLPKEKKTINFVRDNAGKLTMLAMLPVLAEEGLATIKGQKLANKVLDKKLAKYVFKGNVLAYTSYLFSAGALALGSYSAVKIKDKLTEK